MVDAQDETRRRAGELVERALAGDRDAVSSLYRLYERRMVAAAHRRLGHTLHGLMESVDLVQSVWKDVLDDLERFEDRGPDSFFRWLHTCLIHKIDEKRRHHRALKRNVRRTIPLAAEAAAGANATRDPTPSEVVMGSEEAARVLVELSRFPEEQRTVLLLRMRDELTHEEVARRVGKSVEAVKKTYSRGLARLIERLAPSARGP